MTNFDESQHARSLTGQFATKELSEVELGSLIDFGDQDWTIEHALRAGDWATSDEFKVRFSVAETIVGSDGPEDTVVLEVLVPDDHPAAEVPSPSHPGWSKPRGPRGGFRVPARDATDDARRAQFVNSLFRNLHEARNEMGLAWDEFATALDATASPR